MFFDASDTIDAHLALTANGSLGEAYQVATLACCRLITDIALAREWEPARREITVTVDLAAYSANACAAARLLSLSGYWAAATHQLRPLIECTQLFELFRLEPSIVVEWVQAKGFERHEKFQFGAVANLLKKRRGPETFPYRTGFSLWSNAGSHPSESLSWLMTEDGLKRIGPSIYPDRFRLFTADLWAHMTRSTLEFIAAMNALQPDRPAISERFQFDHAVIMAGRLLLAGISGEEVRRYDLSLEFLDVHLAARSRPGFEVENRRLEGDPVRDCPA